MRTFPTGISEPYQTKAIHVMGTGPFQKRNGGVQSISLSRIEIGMTALSALLWRKFNGAITLYTDKLGMALYDSLNLTSLWNHIDSDVLESIPDNINQDIFWASPKLYALKAEKGPVAVIDLDLFVWENLHDRLEGCKLAVLHREDLFPDTYIPCYHLKTRDGYRFDSDWDWNARPCNTAFAFFDCDVFKDFYLDKAMDFMWGNFGHAEENVTQMVFAEQRILAMCAAQRSIEVRSMLTDPYQNGNTTFTHIWGAKKTASEDSSKEEILFEAIMAKIRALFPDYYIIVEKATQEYNVRPKAGNGN